MTRHRFRWKAFLLVCAGLAAAAAGLYAAHRVQQPRNARALLARADRARDERDPDRSARFLGRYLMLNPSDVDARFRYADLLEREAAGGRARALAADVYKQVVSDDPSRSDARRRLAVLLTEAGRWEEAAGHLKLLRDRDPADGAVAALLGRCHAARGDWDAAAGCYGAACGLPGVDPETFARLADCDRRAGRTGEADAAVARMVERFPADHRAFLLRTQYRALHSQPGAADDLREAKRLAPDAADVLLAAADAARGDPAAARAELARGLAAHPKDPRFYLALARLDLADGKGPAAVALLRRGAAEMPDQGQVVVELVHQLLDTGDVAGARSALAAARSDPKVRWAPGDLDLLGGRLAAAAGNWADALPLLEAVRRRVPPESPQAAMADRLLSRNAARVGDLDRQIEFLRRSLAAPNPAARLEYAAALADAGRPEEAAREYRALAEAEPPSVPACLALARWQAGRTLDAAGPGGDWSETDRLLARAEKVAPGNPATAAVRAETLAARGKAEEARAVLRAGCAATPPAPAPWVSLVNLEIWAGRADAARQALDEAVRACGPRVELRLAAVLLAAQYPPDRAVADAARATEGLDGVPPDEAARVWGLAAALYLRLGRYPLAGAAADRVVALRPDNLQSHLLRFEAAVRGRDDAAARAAVDAVRRIEGPGGGLAAYCDALRLVLKAEAGRPDKAELGRARELLTEAAARRPGWPRVPLARAQLDLLEGEPDRAAQSYREAFDQGERSLDVVRRLVQYYTSVGRAPEAYDLIRRLQDKGSVSLAEQRLFTSVYLQTADFARALEAAEKAVSAASTSAADHLWLALVYAAARKPAEADRAFARACELADSPEPWVARAQFLAANNRGPDAEALLTAVREKVAPDKRELTLAGCSEALGRRADADRHFRAALEAAPEDRATVQAAAAHYVRTGRFPLAEPLLRKSLALPGNTPAEVRGARRQLAVGMAEGGNYRRCGEALTLLDQNAREAGEDRSDALARAAVLAKRPGGKLEAIRLYEQLAARPLPAEARYILAQLQIITGGVARGREQMLLAISLSDENPAYVAHWAGVLIADGSLDDAQYWVGRLARRGADRWPVVELQARLLHARGRTADAAARVVRHAPANDPEALAVALRLEEYKDAAGAEKLFAAVAGKKDTPPVVRLAYAAFLARQGRVPEALDLCDAVRGALPAPVVAGMALEFLGYGHPDPGAYRRVEGWLDGVKPDGPDARPAAFVRAAALDRKGDYAAAAAAYRKLAASGGDDPFALVPLATLILFSGGPAAEAEGLLARAVAAGGPEPDAVGLSAAAKFRAGRAADAVADLRRNLAEHPTPNGHARLARALRAAGDTAGAEAALKEALRRGFRPGFLHPLEAKDLDTLLAARRGNP